MIGLTAAENQVDGFALTADPRARRPGAAPGRPAGAFDDKGRRIADAHARLSRPARRSPRARSRCPSNCATISPRIAHRRRATGRRRPPARRQLQAPPRRAAVAGGGATRRSRCCRRSTTSAARSQPFADLVEPPSADLAVAIPQLLDQKPSMIVMADIGTHAGRRPCAADRLGRERRHAGPLRRLAPCRRRHDDELCRSRCATANARSAARCPGPTPQPVAEFPATGPFADLHAADRGDRQAAGAGRADARPRRAHLGEPCRRHAAGHRRTGATRARSCCSMSRRRRHGRTCRSPAPSSRCCAASCSCRATRARSPPTPKASAATLAPYRMIDGQRRAGAADAGRAAADAVGQAPLPVTHRKPARPLWHRGRRLRPQSPAADADFAPLDRPQIAAPVTDCAMLSTNRAT